MLKANILGVTYNIYFKNETQEPALKDNWGFCDYYSKRICIRDDIEKETSDGAKNLVIFKNKVMRHEILHAFLYESGLRENSFKTYSWAENEEMVDWFAIQFPKLLKVYRHLKIIDIEM